MRSKLLYLFSGVLLAAVVLVGAGLLRGQGSTSAPRWEYEWVQLDSGDPAGPLTSVVINGVKTDFTGNLSELFNKLGADGWEYAGTLIPRVLFKRPLP